MWGWQTSNSSLLQILHSSMSSERGIGLRGGGGPGKYVGGQFGERRKCDRVSFLGLSTVLQKICAQKNPGSLWSPKAEKFEFLLLHSVLSGGVDRRQKDYTHTHTHTHLDWNDLIQLASCTPQKRTMPNCLTCVIIAILSNDRHFNQRIKNRKTLFYEQFLNTSFKCF